MLTPTSVKEMQACYDYAMLADVVEKEARGETFEGKVAVAEVVLNRIQDVRWPDTISQVVLQPYQFSAYNKSDPNRGRRPDRDDPVYKECCRAAVWALQGSNMTDGATHYLNVEETKRVRKRLGRKSDLPKWAKDGMKNKTAKIGKHTFLRI